MPDDTRKTLIHERGLDGLVAELVRNRASCPAIVRYIELEHPEKAEGITTFKVQYFKDHFVPPEEILPPAKIREKLQNQSSLVDVVSLRAGAIQMILEMMDTIRAAEKKWADIAQLTGKSQLPKWLELLNTYLDAQKRDMFDLGILDKATSGPPPAGATVNLNQTTNIISSVQLEQAMIEGGMDARRARLAIARALYGPERLGEGQPVPVCAETLDDQG